MRKIKILFSFLLLGTFIGCENPMDDFNIHISPTFYKYVIEVSLTDLSNPDEFFNGEIDIAISGEDAASIYNIDGKKDIKANFGSIQLITTTSNEPTSSNPLRFTVEITSNNYRSESIDIVVNENDYYVSRNIAMLNKSNLPSGINLNSATAGLQSDGSLGQEFKYISDPNSGNPSQIELTMPAGVRFMTSNGTLLNGSDVKVEILSLNDTNAASQLSLPNGSGAVQTVMINGVAEKIMLEPGATFDIDMEVGGGRVSKFTDSIDFAIPLPSFMYNEEAGRPYQAGDKLSLISNSHGDSTWALEGNYTVESVNGELVIKPSVNHLCWFRMSRPYYPISLPPMNYITFTNTLSQAMNTTVMVELRNSSSGYKFYTPYYLSLQPGQSRTFSYRQSIIIDQASLSGASSKLPEYTVTASGRNININFKEAENSVEVGYKLYCTSSKAYVSPPAGVKMYYRETAVGGRYNLLYTFNGENNSDKLHKVSDLKAGMNYDFRAHYGQHQVDTSNVLVVDKKIYQVNLPYEVCEVIGF